VVRLHPEEYAVASRSSELRRLLDGKGEVSIKEDPAVGRAGCMVETVRGNIDAGLDAQLDEVMKRLHEERNTRRGEPGDA